MSNNYISEINKIPGAEAIASDFAKTGVHVDAVIPAGEIRSFAQIMLRGGFLLESVSAVDVTPQMMCIYHFTNVDYLCRIVGRAFIARENPSIDTISDIFDGANWHERETHDFFGILYNGHPDMTPLVLPEDAGDLKPLLKSAKALKDVGAILPRFAPPKAEGAEEKPKAERPAKAKEVSE